MFEISAEEKKFIIDYLRDKNGEFIFKMNERIEFNTHKAIIV